MRFISFAMFKINPLMHTVNQYKGKLPAFSHKIATSECDVFVKQDSFETVKDCAKSFREGVIKPFSDWQSPEIFDKESKITYSLFTPFTDIIDKFSEDEARYFTKLVFGENTIEAFEIAGKKNKDIKLFKETLEKRLGTTIKDVLK